MLDDEKEEEDERRRWCFFFFFFFLSRRSQSGSSGTYPRRGPGSGSSPELSEESDEESDGDGSRRPFDFFPFFPFFAQRAASRLAGTALESGASPARCRIKCERVAGGSPGYGRPAAPPHSYTLSTEVRREFDSAD